MKAGQSQLRDVTQIWTFGGSGNPKMDQELAKQVPVASSTIEVAAK
jgi:hypothetical protein